jgi:hypothetical protein
MPRPQTSVGARRVVPTTKGGTKVKEVKEVKGGYKGPKRD